MTKREDSNGLILVNKPRGLTSHDVVNYVRKKLNTKRVGHAGTLDPQAEGLLIILVGRYTKFFSR
ncbi:MAG: tRNA pseudouridine(55) synthase, partial [Candidatus Omnitrophota bacterium]